jgi:hypothetical protein
VKIQFLQSREKVFSPRQIFRFAGIMLVVLKMWAGPQRVSATTAMIFCNGNMGSASGLSSSQINGLKASGFTTMVLFTMTVQSNGNFSYGDGSLVCSNGSYVGPFNWATLLGQCRTAPSSILRIEMCVGGANDPSFGNIRDRIAADGSGSGTVLYRNLQALKTGLGIDAIDYDDEHVYDSSSAISFGQMCSAVGMKVTLCPYTNPSYWNAVKAGLGNTVDYVYLQCYEGGAGNDPASWASSLGVPVSQIIPGYWDFERDTTFLNKMSGWGSEGCTGGFLWPSCTGCNPPADPGEMSQYANWIFSAFGLIVAPAAAADVVGSRVNFVAAFGGAAPVNYQWKVIKGGATNNIPGATNATLSLINLQLTNSASYQLQASNIDGIFVSRPGSLTVSSVPAAVNNVITAFAAQTGLGPPGATGLPFTPTWIISSNNSLVAGRSPSSTSGNFSLESSGRSVSALTAGGSGTITVINGPFGITTSTNYVTCGNGGGAGASIIYTLTGSATGYNLTNIVVYGGWGDAGRDQQAYTIYYSTISAPTVFTQLSTVNYNPSNPLNVQSASRASLTPASGALATNVATVKFDFTIPTSENGYCGYSQIALFGRPTLTSVPPVLSGQSTMGSAGFVINFSSLFQGQSYQLQSSTNLSANTWTAETNFVATQSTASFTNSIFDAQRFYRLVAY